MRADAASPVPQFFLRAAACLLLAVGAWWSVKDLATLPAAWVSKFAVQTVFSDLVRTAHVGPATLEADTYLRMDMTRMQGTNLPRGLQADLVVEVHPAKYGYSLPLLVALLLAGSRRRFLRNAVLGWACLVPVQAFTIVLVLVRQAVLGAGPVVAAQTGWGQWQFELMAYGYQLGVLLLPTLAPVLLWLWLDRHYFAAVLVEGWLRSAPLGERTPS